MSDAFQVKNLVDATWRRKWWVIAPTVMGLVVAIVLLKTLPNVYRATTTVLVVSQRLPETYVRTTVTSGVQERLASLRVQILGPSYLDRVIEKLALIPPGASQVELEQARRRLAQRIEVPDMGRNASFFEISVEDGKAERSAEIANLLADLFIERNGQQRTEQAASTATQLKVWADDKKRLLDALEERYANYSKLHYGELPAQQSTNQQLINVAQGRLGQVSSDIMQRQNRLEILRSQAAMESTSPSGSLPPSGSDPALIRLKQLEAELAQLRLSYTDQNPDVRKKVTEIEEFKKLNAAVLSAGAGGAPGTPPLTGPRAEIGRLEGEIRRLEADRDGLNRQIDQLTSKVSNIPLREQELLTITRDRDTLRTEYQDLMRKYEEASRAEDLESAGKAEHFRVQDRAGVPTFPSSPNPPLLIGMGVLVGLMLGVGIAFVLEKVDQTVRTEEAFKVAFPDLPLLVSIPNLQAAASSTLPGIRRGKRRKSAAALLLVIGPIASGLLGLV